MPTVGQKKYSQHCGLAYRLQNLVKGTGMLRSELEKLYGSPPVSNFLSYGYLGLADLAIEIKRGGDILGPTEKFNEDYRTGRIWDIIKEKFLKE